MCEVQSSPIMISSSLALFFVFFSFLPAILAEKNVSVRFELESPNFKVYVDDNEWLRSGIFKIRYGGKWWSSESKDKYSLMLSDNTEEDGADSIGAFFKRRYTWTAFINASAPTKVKVETAVSTYVDRPSVVVLDLVYITGLTDASDPSTMENGILSTFPSFYVEDGEAQKGWMAWAGNMASVTKFGRWSSSEAVYGNFNGGFPLAIFDSHMETATVMSPLNTFMAATQTSFTSADSKDTMLTFGPLASIDTIPAGYRYRTIMVTSDNVTSAMRMYGEIMRKMYQKSSDYRKTDYSINYLGYWTDNGACYYYYNGSYANYEDLLLAVKKDADEKELPFRYVQLDSWWYYKGEGDGVKNWTAMPEVFPNGIESMVVKTGWPVVAHNRYWSKNTDYAKMYNFIIDGALALPDDPKFWDYLISSSLSWKLIVYEQDWLDTETDSFKYLKTDLMLGEKWLTEMGASAERFGVNVQYCMPWPRHVLQSVMVPAVTQIRVSDDYIPNNNQWLVGDSTILAHAMGLAAFKDNFRSSTSQPSCTDRFQNIEHAPVLETYVASMTGGPVGPSDMIGKADTTLIMATCMKDGRLLKVSRPAMSLDSTLLHRAFGSGGPKGNMTAAFTEVDEATWYYVMAAQLEADYALSGSELPPSRSTFPASRLNHVVFQYDVRTGEVFGIENLTSDSSITVGKCEKIDFKYFVVAPLLENGMALFGELDKFVTVSETRFTHLDQTGSRTFATVRGVPSEVVKVTVYNGKSTVTVNCVIGNSGYADLAISATPTCV